MRVLMLGWEFPPFISGGLGTACYGLTRAMSEIGIDVLFVLPRPAQAVGSTHVSLVSPRPEAMEAAEEASGYESGELDRVTLKTVDAVIAPYQTPEQYVEQLQLQQAAPFIVQAPTVAAESDRQAETAEQPTPAFVPPGGTDHYAGDLFSEVQRYAQLAVRVAKQEDFDVIHAHDWMTYPAGVAVAAVSGKPLVVHVHSTEFDRSGENVNQQIYRIEHQGVHQADRVICVSFLTKNIVVNRYAVPEDKVEVVYNAIISRGPNAKKMAPIRRDEKIVLFLGRITMQKGPEYFLAAARKVLSVMENVRFIMAGSGDMIRQTIEMAAEMGIGHKVLFTGFLRGDDVARVFEMADLYVMPSVSEPFGIAPLEALSHDVPVLISKQSGVSEVLTHVLKVDFWDVEEMANKIVAVLRHPPLHATLKQHGTIEVTKLSWADSARKCLAIYEDALRAHQ